MRNVFQLSMTLAALAAVALLVACGGSGQPSGSASPQQPSTAADSASNLPPAAAVEPTATPGPSFDFSQVTPVALSEIVSGANLTLGGAADWQAESEIASALDGVGLAADVYVFPISGTQEWLLVLEVSEDAIAPILDNVVWDAVMQALLDAPAVQDGRITRLAVNLHTSDEQGPFVLTITLPMSAVQGSADGTMTDEEVQAQTLTQIDRAVGP
jgi:hypothetical protein